MRVDFDTNELTPADGMALAVLIHQKFPQVLGQLAFMTNAAAAALNVIPARESPSAEEAFAGEEAPPSVAPSAEAAFAGGPPFAGADTSPSTIDAGGPPADASTADPSHTGTNASGADLAASPSNLDLDADGLPYDARIHSGGAKKNGDGRWAKKRGVSSYLVAQVTAELRAALAVPLAGLTAAAAPPPPTPGVPTSSTPPTIPAVPTAPAVATAPPPPGAPAVSAPPAPPAPAPVTTPGAPVASPATTTFPPEVARAAEAQALADAGGDVRPPGLIFADVMRQVVDLTGSGKITAEDLKAVSASCGIESPRDILSQPLVAPLFLSTLNAFAASKG